MNGFHEITVRLLPQLLEIVSESKMRTVMIIRYSRVIGGLRDNDSQI